MFSKQSITFKTTNFQGVADLSRRYSTDKAGDPE